MGVYECVLCGMDLAALHMLYEVYQAVKVWFHLLCLTAAAHLPLPLSTSVSLPNSGSLTNSASHPTLASLLSPSLLFIGR